MIRKGTFIKTAREISVSSALAITLLATPVVLPGCSSGGDDESAYSYEETSYGKGIRSHIREVKAGEFRITDEESVEPAQSGAIVTYLDGHTDSLSTTAAKALIDNEVRTNPGYVGHHSGLTSMLLYGGIGYMLGRNANNGYINSYRDRDGGATARGFYANPDTYNRARTAVSNVNASRTTRTVTARPKSGRSGFFGRSSSRSGG
ncbi:hypothetical protein [Dyadobacter sandarakinus]|uniref:UPF0323 domain-containing protein n=1 Tax=Dyadobacter sandarakinus TaxID=2747268 RepID=A0ABX7I7C8_9BACT|nr:hypothetical protein [Dyadobacter sandarakinus]QRR02006.1 hypothetical protein HWI92_14355 [Dyadobacter sandarakinus]